MDICNYKTTVYEIYIDKNKVFEEIVQDYSSKIIRVCYLQTGNKIEAEDLAQEVLMKVYKNLKAYKGDADIYTWIYRIALNTCYTYLKKEKRLIADEIDENTTSDIIVEEEVANNIKKEILKKAIFSMPQNLRVPLYMFYFENFKIGDIAKVLESNENTIKTRLRRGREWIYKNFGGELNG